MKPVQVHFTEAEAARLKAWAKARRLSQSEVVRQAVRAMVQRDEPDAFLASMGMLSLGRDAAANFDRQILEAEDAKRKAQREAAKPVRGHGRVARRAQSRR